jgi:hypothetical protein
VLKKNVSDASMACERDAGATFGHFEPRWAPPFPPCELLRRIGTWRAVASAGASEAAVSRGVPKRRAHVERQRVRERTWCIVVV